MEQNDNGEWVLEFTANNESLGSNRVVITEEIIVDEIPEQHVIEGDF